MANPIPASEIKDMAFILIAARDRDIFNLEKRISKLETALKKTNEINKQLNYKLQDYKNSDIPGLHEIINELESEIENLQEGIKKRPRSIADFYIT